jgi:alkaline phosphatase
MNRYKRSQPGLALLFLLLPPGHVQAEDFVRQIQALAAERDSSPVGHWGAVRDKYSAWGKHSNRLIPVYTYGTRGAGTGVDLTDFTGPNSAYRSGRALAELYGRAPTGTQNAAAEYLDQTDLARIQRQALRAGKKYIVLFIFDGMDWQTTQAAAIYNRKQVAYTAGRGVGTHFQEYAAEGTSQFGWMVAAPHNDGTRVDVDEQRVLNPGGTLPGGYNPAKGGFMPWAVPSDPWYLLGLAAGGVNAGEHPYPDSAATATAMTCGQKTYNEAINVDYAGMQLTPVAHVAQSRGMSVGVVTSVPISHATPASSYAHNVSRDDYQDLSRDLLGLPSVSHPQTPLAGVDVLLGGGFGHESNPKNEADYVKSQGTNFVPGNLWVTRQDLQTIDEVRGGHYVLAGPMPNVSGSEVVCRAARRAAGQRKRLFGMFGIGAYGGHLPFATADGQYDPAPGNKGKAEVYEQSQISENPTLAEMTAAALRVLETNDQGFWLMVEAGDVDWANHDNNLDNAIGAVNSGDAAFRVVTDWVERRANWKQALVIVTADHGHFLVLDQPEALAGPRP